VPQTVFSQYTSDLYDGLKLRRTMTILKPIATTLYILLLMFAAGFGIDSASEHRALILFALPFAIALILAMRVLGAKSELAALAVFTAWLGLTYLQTGQRIEIVGFIFYVGLALLGAFKSPYFLAFAWVFHPAWDFVPRQLPDLLKDLPTACILFDIPIGLYVFWFARQGRWVTFGRKAETPISSDTQHAGGI
jgi:hypothetical protein